MGSGPSTDAGFRDPATVASDHQQAAVAAEERGDLDAAVLELNLALRAQPSDVRVLWHLAEIRLDQGQLDRARRCLRRILELVPSHPEAVQLLASMDAGRAAPPTSDDDGEAPSPPGTEAASPLADTDVLGFALTFAGRDGVYARQWASPTGKTGYSPVHEPFTPAVARRHLDGEITVGVYPVRHDYTSRWLCLDIDITVAARRAARTREARRQLDALAHDTARKLLDILARLHLPGLIEDSGGKGRHVWVLFEAPLPAVAAKRIGQHAVSLLDEVNRDVQVEVFPKQSRNLAPDQLGNLVKLPLGLHRGSQRRSTFLSPDGQVAREPLRVLAEQPRASLAELRGVLAGLGPSAAAHATQPGEPTSAAWPDIAVPSYRLVLDPEAAHLRSRCSVLRTLVERTIERRVISSHERNVVTYTLGHLSRGADAVNEVLSAALNVSPQDLLKRPLRGHPMSCPKIRSRVPELASEVGCDCVFDAAASYPHPLLHLSTLRARSSAIVAPARPPQTHEPARPQTHQPALAPVAEPSPSPHPAVELARAWWSAESARRAAETEARARAGELARALGPGTHTLGDEIRVTVTVDGHVTVLSALQGARA